MSLKICFICKTSYTNKDLLKDRFGRLYHLPIQLAELGAEVLVLCIDYRGKVKRSLKVGSVEFKSLPFGVFSALGAVKSISQEVKSFGANVIIGSGDSHIGAFGSMLAKKIGAKSVFDVYDYYPSFRTNHIPGMRSLFAKAVKEAHLVTCASKALVTKLKCDNQSILLVNNGVDLELFKPYGTHNENSGGTMPTIGYFGSITSSRGPILLDACRILREKYYPDLRLLLAGPVFNIELKERWIDYRGVLPQGEIPKLIYECDVVTLPYMTDDFNSHSGACKISEYIACQKPIVATAIADHVEIFSDVSESLSEPNAIKFSEAIRNQVEEPQVAILNDNFLWSEIAKTLFSSLKKLF